MSSTYYESDSEERRVSDASRRMAANAGTATNRRNHHGEEKWKNACRGEQQDVGAERPQAALAAVVRQSGKSRHDRALSRALPQLRPHARGADVGQTDHRHRADRLRPLAVQPPSPAARRARARRHPRRRRHRIRVSVPSDPGDRQAPDRRARSQPRLSGPGRDPVRVPDRRRGADHRLRQDHAGLPDGGRDREHPGDRALGRADAQRLVEGRARRLRHRGLEGARGAGGGAHRPTRNSSIWSPRRRRRSATATPWAPPRP